MRTPAGAFPRTDVQTSPGVSMQLPKPSAEFSPISNGVILAPYAELAYMPQSLKGVHHAWDKLKPFKHGSAQGFVAHKSPQLVVSIAGTNDLVDIGQDLDIQSTVLTNGRTQVHKGFADHALEVRAALAKFDFNASPTTEVWIVGHSLGGAAAVLLPLVLDLPGTIRVVTYGAPPVIGQGFGGRYNVDVTRFAHVSDLVPKPLRALYEHVGRPFWIRANGQVSGSPSMLHRAWGLLAKVWRIASSGIVLANRHYHSMSNYRKSLEAVA